MYSCGIQSLLIRIVAGLDSTEAEAPDPRLTVEALNTWIVHYHENFLVRDFAAVEMHHHNAKTLPGVPIERPDELSDLMVNTASGKGLSNAVVIDKSKTGGHSAWEPPTVF